MYNDALKMLGMNLFSILQMSLKQIILVELCYSLWPCIVYALWGICLEELTQSTTSIYWLSTPCNVVKDIKFPSSITLLVNITKAIPIDYQ